jgi:hypothetical protein
VVGAQVAHPVAEKMEQLIQVAAAEDIGQVDEQVVQE